MQRQRPLTRQLKEAPPSTHHRLAFCPQRGSFLGGRVSSFPTSYSFGPFSASCSGTLSIKVKLIASVDSVIRLPFLLHCNTPATLFRTICLRQCRWGRRFPPIHHDKAPVFHCKSTTICQWSLMCGQVCALTVRVYLAICDGHQEEVGEPERATPPPPPPPPYPNTAWSALRIRG